jgi:hypothetical protein
MSITVALVIGLVGVAVGAVVYFIDRKSTAKAVSAPVATLAPVDTTEPKVRPIDEPAKPGEKLP